MQRIMETKNMLVFTCTTSDRVLKSGASVDTSHLKNILKIKIDLGKYDIFIKAFKHYKMKE